MKGIGTLINSKEKKDMKDNNHGKTYYSFEDLAIAEFGLKPNRKVTKDKKKLALQREKFLGVCPHCKQPLHYSYGTNIVSCTNEDCKGKKVVIKNEDGTEEVIYKPFYRILQGDNSSTIGTILFDE